MSIFAYIILGIHYTLVSILCIYGAHRIYHSLVAKRLMKTLDDMGQPAGHGLETAPLVTIQIPLYNEKFVAARIIDYVAKFDYPIDKIQIQVLDDSTDESVDIVAERVRHYKNLGYDISHICRDDRAGYKAGALAAAMGDVKGEFIAIFDADFMPQPDFLAKAMPHFKKSNVGLVQARWSYLNTETNMLTRLQSVMLDAHFGVEQVTRYGKGVFFNFNGTAGIWRKAAIEDAGGWKADTLTEDTDLSYRAQMRGWQFVYRPDIHCPSEIPENMKAFKVQQHRWAKGTIEVMKKLLPTIWSSKIELRQKVEASLHLTANITYLLMFVDSLFFLLPTVHLRQQMGPGLLAWLDIPIFAFASLSHAYFFLSGQKRLYGKVTDKLLILPSLLATSIGLGVNNGRAVIEALVGHKTGFNRTPKIGDTVRNVAGNSASLNALQQTYKTNSENWASYLELTLALIYSSFLAWAIYQAYWIVIPFLALFAIGFFYTSLSSLSEGLPIKNRAKKTLFQAKQSIPAHGPVLTEETSKPQNYESLLIAE